jgi:S-adenosylmethionine:diacylglycerol 3-amino-3-carboxypropyl transferase
MVSLPTLFNHGAQNEDASVELLVLDELGARADQPLRVLTVASCGTHVAAMRSSPDVGQIDAVDVAPAQLKVAALVNAGATALSSPEELAIFIGNSGDLSERQNLYRRVRAFLDADVAEFWDANAATVEAGVLRCGGTERLFASVREHLPTQDLAALATQPEAIAAAFTAGFTVQVAEDNMLGLPKVAIDYIIEHGVPAAAAQLSARLADCAAGDPDLMVELIIRGSFPMTPVSSRPQFLRPDVFAAITHNRSGADRVAWHYGSLQLIGPTLAQDSGGFDLVDMSNILNLDSPDDARKIIGELKKAARPGGTLLCRGDQPPGALSRAFADCGLEVDEDMSARALGAESSFLHNEVCVATAQ